MERRRFTRESGWSRSYDMRNTMVQFQRGEFCRFSLADALQREFGENVMPRFYFHLTSKENNIPDDSGKKLDTLTDAYEHVRALIDKIASHVDHDDADVWKLVISNDKDGVQMIVPFAVAHIVRGQCRGTT